MKLLQCIMLSILLTISVKTQAGWVDQNTGINDELTAVQFWGTSNGVLAGKAGIYYTTTGGNGSTSWTRFTITNNSSDAAIYNSCQFKGLTSFGSNEAYFCGKDTVNDKAVIFYFNLSTLTYSFNYIGTIGTGLNSIFSDGSVLYAVGDNGLIVTSDLINYIVLPSGTTKNLYSVRSISGNIGIGGDGIYFRCTAYNFTLFLSPYIYSGKQFRAICPYSASSMLTFGAGIYRLDGGGASLAELTTYDGGPLNGRDFDYRSGASLIATNHGIFKASNFNYFEFEISSAGFDLNSIYSASSTLAYAAGKNGLLLKTTDGGAPVKPYAQTSVTIACKGDVSTLIGNPGSATNCKWMLNSTQISTACGSVGYTFNTIGNYTLSYIVWNSSGIYDTVNQTINILMQPIVSIHTTANDTILCKQETITVLLDSTQANFVYELRKYGSTATFGSVIGSNVADTIYSSLISSGGNYYVNVMSTQSQCTRKLVDTVAITVEHTHADFHSSLINAPLGSNVTFFETATDAQNYKWEFPSNCNLPVSYIANPSNLTFSTTGLTAIKLTSWSDNACYDSLIAPGPFIYAPPVNDSCWAYNIDADNLSWTGYYTRDIAGMTQTSGGYLVCGTGYQIQFTSRLGITPPRTTSGGYYLASYTNDGVIKWHECSRDNSYGTYTMKPVINSVTTDSHGNIYIIGSGKDNVYFYATNGDSLLLANGPSAPTGAINGFVVKLDSLGNLIWKGLLRYTIPGTVKIAPNGDVIIVGERTSSSASYYNNGVTSNFPTMASANYFLLRLNSNGVIKWNAPIVLPHTNSVQCSDFTIDFQGNVMLTGGYEYTSTFYSPNLTTNLVITATPGNYGQEFFLIKYDSLGTPLWKAYGPSTGSGSSGFSIVSDTSGASYVTGYYQRSSLTPMNIINSDGTTNTLNLGGYWLCKFSSSGILQWNAGNQYSYYGYGLGVTMDHGELSTVGLIRENAVQSCSTIMTSTNGVDLSISIDAGDLFVARYDLNGVLKNVALTGTNTGANSVDEKKYIFRDANYRAYIAGDLFANPVDYFGNSIDPNGLYDGFVAKMGVNGCGNSVITSSASRVEEVGDEPLLFPNPMKDMLEVRIPENIESSAIRIFDVLGNLLYTKEISTKLLLINKSEFARSSGIYFLQIKTAKGELFTYKFVLN